MRLRKLAREGAKAAGAHAHLHARLTDSLSTMSRHRCPYHFARGIVYFEGATGASREGGASWGWAGTHEGTRYDVQLRQVCHFLAGRGQLILSTRSYLQAVRSNAQVNAGCPSVGSMHAVSGVVYTAHSAVRAENVSAIHKRHTAECQTRNTAPIWPCKPFKCTQACPFAVPPYCVASQRVN